MAKITYVPENPIVGQHIYCRDCKTEWDVEDGDLWEYKTRLFMVMGEDVPMSNNGYNIRCPICNRWVFVYKKM